MAQPRRSARLRAGLGINDTGQVTGWYFGEAGYQAFVTGPGGRNMAFIGTLGGANSVGYDINNRGQVTGYSDASPAPGDTSGGYQAHAFMTGPDGKGMTDLGTLGGTQSTGEDINDAGQVVGESLLMADSGGTHAFVTGPQGVGMVDLNALIDVPGDDYFYDAVGINDRGQIIANTINHGPYLLSPVLLPEPATSALVLSCLALMGCMARRRKDG